MTSDSVWWELQARGLRRAAGRSFSLRLGTRRRHISVQNSEGLTYRVLVDGEPVELQLAPLGQDVIAPSTFATKVFRIQAGGRWLRVEVAQQPGRPPRVLVDGKPLDVEMSTAGAAPRGQTAKRATRPQRRRGTAPAPGGREKRITAAMPGRIVAVSVTPGQPVLDGQEVCVLEAMKMEQIIRAPADGVVKAVPIVPGQTVYVGDLLVELE